MAVTFRSSSKELPQEPRLRGLWNFGRRQQEVLHSQHFPDCLDWLPGIFGLAKSQEQAVTAQGKLDEQ